MTRANLSDGKVVVSREKSVGKCVEKWTFVCKLGTFAIRTVRVCEWGRPRLARKLCWMTWPYNTSSCASPSTDEPAVSAWAREHSSTPDCRHDRSDQPRPLPGRSAPLQWVFKPLVNVASGLFIEFTKRQSNSKELRVAGQPLRSLNIFFGYIPLCTRLNNQPANNSQDNKHWKKRTHWI